VFIDYKANRLRTLTLRNLSGIDIISTADGSKKSIALPPNTRVANARWTPDGTGVAYMSLGDDSTQVWITDLATNKPRQVTKTSLLTTFVTNFYFTNGGKQIVAVFPPDGRSARPLPPAVPTGPEIKLHMESAKEKNRTFPSLMSTQYDFALLKWHATGQIAIVDVATGVATKFGAPAMITAFDLSPDGKYARVTQMLEPFSYIVPTSAFGSKEEVWDSTGKALAKLTERPINLGAVADVLDPLAPQPDPNAAPAAPAGGGGRGGANNDNGKRELAWRADGQGFNYLQLEPAPADPAGARAGRTGAAGGRGAGGGRAGAGGRGAGAQQAANAPPRKDRLMQWLPPFNDTSTKQLYENPTRMTGARFSPDGAICFFSEGNATKAVYLADASVYTVVAAAPPGTRAGGAAPDPNAAPADPNAAPQAAGRGGFGGGGGGTLLGVGGAGGGGGRGAGGGGGGRGGGGATTTPVLLSADGTSVYLEGGGGRGGASLTKINIKTGDRTPLFTGEGGALPDRISAVLDPEAKRFILMKENDKTVPQQFLYDNGTRKQLTENVDLFPDLTAMVVKNFTVTRPDGFHFKTKVSLPAGYVDGTRLPGFFWFYPAEFVDQTAYDAPGRGGGGGGGAGAQNFATFGSLSKQFLVRLGYAVIENDAPIVGPAGEMNNNYVNDLRNDLYATIEELDRQKIIIREKLAIGGHSYGAFSTVNALVNTPYFKAGIAGDGAYNRTLTPNGFQNERRDLWQAPSVYLDMSPFMKADHLTGALLMYHDMHDQNVGTDPINSTRLFNALIGMGKTVALYRYPFEDHGPAARETCLDLWSRWAAWLDKYVKNPAPDVKPAATGTRRGGGGGQ